MTIEELNTIQAAMPTAELIEKARARNKRLCDSGGGAWSLRVPVSEDDPDMVFSEICRRLEIASNFDKAFALVNSAQAMLEALESIVNKYDDLSDGDIQSRFTNGDFIKARLAISQAKG